MCIFECQLSDVVLFDNIILIIVITACYFYCFPCPHASGSTLLTLMVMLLLQDIAFFLTDSHITVISSLFQELQAEEVGTREGFIVGKG